MTDTIVTVTVTDSSPVIETVESQSGIETVEVSINNTIESTTTVIETVEAVTPIEIIEVGYQGPPGPQGIPGPAGNTVIEAIAGQNLSGHRVIRIDEGKAYYCDSMDVTHAGTAIGVSLGAALYNDTVTIQILGNHSEMSWSWNIGPIFVGVNGQLTQFQTGLFSQQIAMAISGTEIHINPQLAILRSN